MSGLLRRRLRRVPVMGALLLVAGSSAFGTTPAFGSPVERAEDEVEEAEDAAEEAEAAAEAAHEDARRAADVAEEARREADEAEAVVEAQAAELDEAAAIYEEARAHHLTLEGERDAEADRVDRAAEASESDADAFAMQVADFYKRPPVELDLADMVLASERVSDALHRADLLTRVSARGADRLLDSRHLAVLTAAEVQQQHVITAGLDAAAEELDEQREHLAFEVASAEQAAERAHAAERRAEEATAVAERTAEAADGDVDAAHDDVVAAREAAERAVAQEAARAREAAREEAAAAEAAARAVRAEEAADTVTSATSPSAEPAPARDGMACPIGKPHGFSDSWLAPRPNGRQHMGIDMFAAHGIPIYAVEDGTVRASSNRLGGLVIYLTADDGDRYYYAHLSELHVSTGDRVSAGQVIGANGNTGNARTTPPHLHWEVRPGGGDQVNPTPLARQLCR